MWNLVSLSVVILELGEVVKKLLSWEGGVSKCIFVIKFKDFEKCLSIFMFRVYLYVMSVKMLD